jgi:hypothetical protein
MNHIPIGIVRGILALLLTITTPLVSALAVCDGVIAFVPGQNVSIRSSASTSAPIIGSISYNARGRVVEGPINANDHTWWRVYWMENVTGWTAQRHIPTNELYYTNLPVPNMAYGDDILPGWCHQPWSGTTVTPQSTIERVGAFSIRTETTQQYGRLYLKTNEKSLSGINSLRFSIRNSSAHPHNHYVTFKRADGSAYRYQPIALYAQQTGSLLESVWYDVRIPIADLGVTQSSTVYGIEIQSAEPSTFFVDDVALDTVSGSTLWTGSNTVTGVTVSCTPSTITVNQATPCTATVYGTGTFNTGVTWSTNTGAMNASGLFAAPQSPTTATITATSVSDPSKSGSTTVNVVQASQAGAIVYSETIGWGWDVGAWSGLTTNPASPIAYRGTNAIEMKTVGQYRRLPLITESAFRFNTAGYQAISFAINNWSI